MSILNTITVHPGTQLVEYVRGVFTRVLEPGRHKRPRHALYQRVMVREEIATIPVQDVPTSDGLSVRVSAAVLWSVTDARRFLELAAAPFDQVYLAIQVTLRDALVDVPAETAVQQLRQALPGGLLAAARTAGEAVGISVRDVVVKDILMPVELRQAQIELVTARTRGLAELEKARAETAALRSLANAAKLLDDHPALAQLRLVQAVPYGSKLELTVGSTD